MRSKMSAGLLLYRTSGEDLQVFLVHPGGPFWSKKDAGAWTIPKGEFADGEDPLDVAKREFKEETGFNIEGKFEPLRPIRQLGGKTVFAWAVRGDLDESQVRSNAFSMEWPPRSGKMRDFPEVDRGGWFNVASARQKIPQSQVGLLDQLRELHANRVD